MYALAKRANAVGGKCGVSRRLDGKCGTRFWFTIPYRPDAAVSRMLSLVSFDTCGSTSSDSIGLKGSSVFTSCGSLQSLQFKIKCMNILLVEDSPLIQKTTSRILMRENHTVTIANNGAECLDIIEKSEKRFDMILMDIQMPVLDGIETIRRIRQLEETDILKRPEFVVGLSANSDTLMKLGAISAGMNTFVGKLLTVHMMKNICIKLKFS